MGSGRSGSPPEEAATLEGTWASWQPAALILDEEYGRFRGVDRKQSFFFPDEMKHSGVLKRKWRKVYRESPSLNFDCVQMKSLLFQG